jgi:hypothetical protein
MGFKGRATNLDLNKFKAEEFEEMIKLAIEKGFKVYKKFVNKINEEYVYCFALLDRKKPDFFILVTSILDLNDNTENVDVVYFPKRFMDAYYVEQIINMFVKGK